MSHRGLVTFATCIVTIWTAATSAPTAARAEYRCPTPPRSETRARAVRIRALISALIPSVYLEFDTSADRNRDRRLSLSVSDRPRPESGRKKLDTDHRKRWEVGVTWDPIRLLRRSARTLEIPADAVRRDPLLFDEICRTSAEFDLDRLDEASFEERLERAVEHEKRRSLERLFD